MPGILRFITCGSVDDGKSSLIGRLLWESKQVFEDTYSQVHATAFVDLNGDGRKDLVSGKRFLAHDHDPGAREPLGIYWHEIVPGAQGKGIFWARHVIDFGSMAGCGMQIAVAAPHTAAADDDGATDPFAGLDHVPVIGLYRGPLEIVFARPQTIRPCIH